MEVVTRCAVVVLAIKETEDINKRCMVSYKVVSAPFDRPERFALHHRHQTSAVQHDLIFAETNSDVNYSPTAVVVQCNRSTKLRLYGSDRVGTSSHYRFGPHNSINRFDG